MGDLSFYKAVMSTPFVPKAPAPKSKGRKFNPGKLKPAFSAEKIDLFKTFLSGDAGQESMHQSHDFFKLNLKKLSEGELKKLLKKIERMRLCCLKEEKEYEVVDMLYEKTKAAIATQLKHSDCAVKKLKKKVVECLHQMPSLEAKASGANVFIFKKRSCVRFSRFVEEEFFSFVKEYEKLTAEGVIIPSTKNERGVDFVKSAIFPFLHFR